MLKKCFYCLILSNLLFILYGCKTEPQETGSSPILNSFFISSSIDAEGYYKLNTLNVGSTYYGMMNITDEDMDVSSLTVTQVRESDSYTIGPNTVSIPSLNKRTNSIYAEFKPDYEGTWKVSVFVTDSKNNKSNTLSLTVEVWENGKYIITFDGNGASKGEMQKQTIHVGEKINKNHFEKDGYVFIGWNRAADGSHVNYANEEEFHLSYKGNETDYPRNVTFYAQWYDESAFTSSMIFVEGGTFSMGYTGNSSYLSSQLPAHNVTVDSFFISKYEVTQGLFNGIEGAKVLTEKPNYPITLSWRRAIALCNKLTLHYLSENDCVYYSDASFTKVYYEDDAENKIVPFMKIQNKGYRLPTEAEWEYAAKGGKNLSTFTYSGSDNENEVSWNSTNSGNTLHNVGTKLPNALNIFDMSGNVSEWVWDTYGNYSTNSQINPTGPEKQSVIDAINRGRSFDQEGTTVYYRDRIYSEYYSSYKDTGLRIVRTSIE